MTDKQKVLAAISNVRRTITPSMRENYSHTVAGLHTALDDVVAAVSEPSEVLQKSEISLEEHIIAHLLLREQQKKREELSAKAKATIERLEERDEPLKTK